MIWKTFESIQSEEQKNEEEYRKPTGIMGPNDPPQNPPTTNIVAPHPQGICSMTPLEMPETWTVLNPIHYTDDKV